MPFVTPKGTSSSNSTAPNPTGRATFRPPWVKDEGAQSALKPTPKTPWAKKATESPASSSTSSSTSSKENGESPSPTGTVKKTTTAASKAASTPATKKPSETTTTTTAAKKTPEPVTKKSTEPVKKTVEPVKKPAEPAKKIVEPVKKVPEPVKKVTPTPVAAKKQPEPVKKPTLATTKTSAVSAAKKKEPTPSSSEEEETDEEEEETEEETEESSEEEEEESEEVPAPPPLPSLVPKAPPPPPPPLGAPGDKKTLSEQQKAALEKLKTRPRRRPDWSEMMKEVEQGKKLRHVQCNDRSQPILTCKSMTKVDNKFIYETEKDNSHNKLLKQIQGGVKLKPTKTNDRSKPILEGLRKFRRQMTIEEQLQKSQSKINMLTESAPDSTAKPAGILKSSIAPISKAISIEETSADELDDIDKLRDDLQSTKQMLALELRNREAQERENKKLLAKIATLEAELEREKSREKNLEYGSNVIVATMDPTPSTEQLYVNSLKKEAEDARKISKDLEKKYLDIGEVLDQAKTEIEEQKAQIKMLEKKLAQALQGGGSLNGSRRPSDALGEDSSGELELEASESDPDEPEEKKAERREKRLGKEVKILRSKLTKLKVKQEAAKKEKDALKQAMKKNQVILKEEQKKYKKLEKEVHKMAASMKLDDEDMDLDGDEEDKAENEEEAEEEESEEESSEESEESESEEEEEAEKSESESEDAPNADKKSNLEPRVKKHESRLSAMKKCNVLLQANVDNLQDNITQVRSKAASLQSELDSVLADLGF